MCLQFNFRFITKCRYIYFIRGFRFTVIVSVALFCTAWIQVLLHRLCVFGIDGCLVQTAEVVLVVVVVDFYSASRSASNALIVPSRRKKMSFQRRFEAVGTPSRVPEWVWKRVPFRRTGDGESPTTKRAATVSWNHQLVTVGRSKALAAWDVRCTRAVVHQVLRSLILQTPV